MISEGLVTPFPFHYSLAKIRLIFSACKNDQNGYVEDDGDGNRPNHLGALPGRA